MPFSGGGSFTGGTIPGPLHVGGDSEDGYLLTAEPVPPDRLAFAIVDAFDDLVVDVQLDQVAGVAHVAEIRANVVMASFVNSVEGLSVNVNGSQTAAALRVLVAGVPTFEVRPDGSVHIKTGKTVVADL